MEPDLVEQAQRGDRQAFASLAYSLSDRLFPVAHRILRDFESAGDAVQDTLVRMWRDLPALRDPARFEAWSYRLLVHACMDQLRASKRHRPDLHLLPGPYAEDGPELTIVVRDQLDRAFHRLPLEQRAVVVLHYYRDLSLQEIAEALGVPIGTVRSRLHYARRALRAAIEADSRPAIPRGHMA